MKNVLHKGYSQLYEIFWVSNNILKHFFGSSMQKTWNSMVGKIAPAPLEPQFSEKDTTQALRFCQQCKKDQSRGTIQQTLVRSVEIAS